MDPSSFAEGVRVLVGKTRLFGDQDLEAAMVANPRAGGFSGRKRAADAARALSGALAAAESLPDRGGRTGWRLLPTEEPRHAGRMAAAMLEEAAMKPGPAWLVVLASGDGTSLEFLDELSRAPAELRERFTVLRLPMGTGNDGSDGRELSDSLSRLVGSGRVDVQPALRVIPNPAGPAARRAPGGEWRAFNIASVGLDAFVTRMTNRLKAILPGDSYKLWVDLASVFYDRLYDVGDMTILGTGPDGAESAECDGRFLLVAMGVSGHRTYGSNKPILPDDDNVCAIHQMPLLRKLALKGPISSGRHRGLAEALLFSADRLELGYDRRVLAQMDGEAEELVAEDFPLVMERTPPLIRHLARA